MKLEDPQYLLNEQYKDASNLNARIRLHERFSTNPSGIHRWMFDQFTLPENANVLELGCGPANLWHEHLDRVPAGWRVTLTDFSPGMVATAQDNLTGHSQFTFNQVDAQSIPYDDASFDGVMAHYMLYHVPDRSKALSEIARVLKPGCKFYSVTLGENHIREIFDFMRDFDSDWSEGHSITPYTLENGAAQITPFFSTVELHLYKDSLEITETEPLVAYILSMSRMGHVDFTSEKVDALRAKIDARLAHDGVIHVQKNSGMFIAVK